jgi:hypothetical protein
MEAHHFLPAGTGYEDIKESMNSFLNKRVRSEAAELFLFQSLQFSSTGTECPILYPNP